MKKRFFYYKIELATTDTSATPSIADIQVWYNLGSYATVSSQAATSVASLTAQGNGTIVAEGSSDVTKRGFQYGVSQTLYNEVSETGSYSAGVFSLELPNLYAGTGYYVRAFVENTEGRAYGDWVQFTTNSYYYDTSTLQSINLLAAATVSSINSFYTSTTVPSGTSLLVQFSQDNFAWYSAAGFLNETTSIPNGTTTTSLSALGWTTANFYYKFTFNSNTARDATPSLDGIVLNYNAPTIGTGPSDGGSSSGTPTIAGNNVVFIATATDPSAPADNYYLAVCKTNSITAVNNGAPTCASVPNTLCVSGSTVSGA